MPQYSPHIHHIILFILLSQTYINIPHHTYQQCHFIFIIYSQPKSIIVWIVLGNTPTTLIMHRINIINTNNLFTFFASCLFKNVYIPYVTKPPNTAHTPNNNPAS